MGLDASQDDYERFLKILRCLKELGIGRSLPSRALAARCGREYNSPWFGDIATLNKIHAIKALQSGDYALAERGEMVLEGRARLSELMKEIRTVEITKSGLDLEDDFDNWCGRPDSGFKLKAKKGWPDRLLLDSEGKPVFVEIKKSGKVDDADQRRMLGYLAQISAMSGNTFGVKVATFDRQAGTWELREVPLPTE